MLKKEKVKEPYSGFREEVLDLVDRAIHFYETRIVDDKLLPSRIKDECFYQLIGRFDNFSDLSREVGYVSNFVDVFLSGVEYAIDTFNLKNIFRWVHNSFKRDTN